LSGERTDRTAGSRPRRRWLMLAATVLGVFVFTMGLVTAVEAVAGRPLESLIWHRQASGTTIGNLVTGPAHHAHPAGRPSAPAASPSAVPSSPAASQDSPSPSAPATSASPGTSAGTGATDPSAPAAGAGAGTAPGTGTGAG
jgi:hypothetical protein